MRYRSEKMEIKSRASRRSFASTFHLIIFRHDKEAPKLLHLT